jgi:carboxylesterase type B
MEDVIVVTINYRLHALGFACIPEMGIYGNAGLKDQQLALEWIHENISEFGGDNENVTLFGESAGASCVHLHLLNSKSRQYFHKIISQSGSPLNNWLIQNDGEEKTRRIAKMSKCLSLKPFDIYNSLMNIDLKQLALSSKKVQDYDEKRRSVPTVLKPVVEKENENSFLTKLPIDIIKNQKFDIPIMIGGNNCEGTGPSHVYKNRLEIFSDDMIRTIPRSVRINPESKEAHILAREISEFYFGEKGLKKETYPQFVQLIGDVYFTNYTIMTMEMYHKYQPNCKQYAFEFCLDTKLNLMKRMLNLDDIKGAGHFDEISYLFE